MNPVLGAGFSAGLERFIARTQRGLNKLYRPTVTRKRPMTLDRILGLLPLMDITGVWDFQVLTMMMAAHDGLLRAGELVALRWSDVEWTADGDARLTIRISKTTHDRSAEEVVLYDYDLPALPCRFSGAHLVRELMRRRAAHGPVDPEALLFPPRPGSRARAPATLKRMFVGRVQELLSQAGWEAAGFSGHSFRSGGATDLWAAGTDPRTIQLQGRWRSDAFWLYVRDDPTSHAIRVRDAFSKCMLARAGVFHVIDPTDS